VQLESRYSNARYPKTLKSSNMSLLTRNIKLNVTLASRTDSFQQGSRLLRRGERTIPKRYIKSAHWLKVGDDERYFAVHKGTYFPIEFNYEHCYWYCVKYSDIRSTWETLRVAPSEYFLDIQDDEVVPRSDWGLLDQDDPETDNEEGTPAIALANQAAKANKEVLKTSMSKSLKERMSNTKHNCKC
jgi:hypothetical protein